ncbi:MAG: periplasmic copper-binding protein [Ignavibacteria bacterium]|nr:MAG: periplasmic copper-binding protein [Ignavibacteria bacterium]KAF0154232.1 MAG: periplasmic copper-binding protein [Ignavibacteria bacterium]
MASFILLLSIVINNIFNFLEHHDNRAFSLEISAERNENFNSFFRVISQVELQDHQFPISAISAMCVDNGKLVILDTQGKQVLVFKQNGILLSSIGKIGSGPGEYKNPYHMDINKYGDVLILDTGNMRVSKFTLNGSFVTSNNVKLGVRIKADNNTGFYLYNSTESAFKDKGVISHYNEAGQNVNTFCKPFFKIGMVGVNFSKDNDQNLYIAHSTVYSIKKYSSKGHFIKEFGVVPKNFKGLDVPINKLTNLNELDETTPVLRIVVTPNNLVIIEYSVNKKSWLDIYDTSGKLLKAGIKLPQGMRLGTSDKDNQIYFIQNPTEDFIGDLNIKFKIISGKFKYINK